MPVKFGVLYCLADWEYIENEIPIVHDLKLEEGNKNWKQ